MVEVMLPESSGVVGRTLVQARSSAPATMSRWSGCGAATWPVSDNLTNEELRVGDTLLVAGFWSDIRKLQTFRRDMVVLESAGRAGRGAAGGQPGAAGAGLPRCWSSA